MSELLKQDLEFIFSSVQWDELNNASILITGASGFIGSWMVDSLVYANRKLNLKIKLYLLTRDIDKFYDKLPHLKNNNITLIQGDIRTFGNAYNFDYVLHFATHEGHRLTVDNPLEMYDVIVNGTWHTLEVARLSGCKKFLFMSSGVVNKNEQNVYAMGKRSGELLCNLYHKQYGMDVKIARGYAFVGARLPLDKHFAIGNFIGNVLRNEPVLVKSNGLSVRSYLYMADAVVWLWTILFKGQSCVPYEVGSGNLTTIRELAKQIAGLGNQPLIIEHLNTVEDSYYPGSLKNELGLKQNIFLREAINRTLEWYRLDNR